MSGNSFGNSFVVTTFGESHGVALGCIIDGCPPGLDLSKEDIQIELDKRKPGSPGKLVDLESTIKGFDAICKGEYDHLPEAAFYMVGTIEEAIEKAEKMAKEAAA